MMNKQKVLEKLVLEWQVDRRGIDHGRWLPEKNGTLAYRPTKREIRAKCQLFRTIAGWHDANKRAPRGGEFSVATMAGV